MACVLTISASGNVWWGKRSTGWVQLPQPDKGPVWVLTDLSEESFVEITVPRVFGNDRRNYVERQLANRFPESRFRVSVPAQRGGGLMDRLAPPVEILTAIEPADRVKDALAGLESPLVGVWSTSTLLAQVGCQKYMPANLLVVLSQPSGMRILFIKDRTPVLTRLVARAETAAEQSLEILRTMRHLENTRAIERGRQRFPVMLVGVADGLADILAGDRLDALDAAIVRKAKLQEDWQQALLTMVCKSPAGQLAPMSMRERYLAMRLSLAAGAIAVVCVLGTIAAAAGNVGVIVSDHRERNRLEATIGELDNAIAEADTAIGRFGVAPTVLRMALSMDSDEIVNAPDMPADLIDLSHTISQIPGARAQNLQWRVLDAGEAACTSGGAAPGAVAAPEPEVPQGAEPTASSGKTVELKLSIALAADAGPQLRQQQANAISRQLANTTGVRVLQDPAKTLRDGDLSAGSAQAGSANELEWCASLAGRGLKAPGGQP
jgi:hypothetical protein